MKQRYVLYVLLCSYGALHKHVGHPIGGGGLK